MQSTYAVGWEWRDERVGNLQPSMRKKITKNIMNIYVIMK